MGFHRAPLQNGFYHARYTSNFKLEDIKMFLRKCCYQGQNFKRKFHANLEFFF